MKIGFYGDSKACWAKFPIYDDISFIDIVCEHYQAKLINKGVPQGSEERILKELKKSKEPDMVVIFHSQSSRFYLPQTDRDIDVRDFNKFFDDRKANYIWKAGEKNRDSASEFFDYGQIKDKFKDLDEFIATISLYKKHLYDADVHLNRYYGSLVQIDQFLTHKKIPSIHVIDPNAMPSWFKFQSGETATDLFRLSEDNFELGTFPNNISKKGQQRIAKILISKIDNLLSHNKK